MYELMHFYVSFWIFYVILRLKKFKMKKMNYRKP